MLGIHPLQFKGYASKRTHQGLPSVRIMPKSMTYRDTAYLNIYYINAKHIPITRLRTTNFVDIGS